MPRGNKKSKRCKKKQNTKQRQQKNEAKKGKEEAKKAKKLAKQAKTKNKTVLKILNQVLQMKKKIKDKIMSVLFEICHKKRQLMNEELLFKEPKELQIGNWVLVSFKDLDQHSVPLTDIELLVPEPTLGRRGELIFVLSFASYNIQ